MTDISISKVTGILRHEMMDFMFADPLMLDDLDYLFKCDVARKLMFYHQPKYKPPPPVDKSKVFQSLSLSNQGSGTLKCDLRFLFIPLYSR